MPASEDVWGYQCFFVLVQFLSFNPVLDPQTKIDEYLSVAKEKISGVVSQ